MTYKKRINGIPLEKLDTLNEFISKLEKRIDHKSKTMELAGAWKDLDDEVFDELTNKLVFRRPRNSFRNELLMPGIVDFRMKFE